METSTYNVSCTWDAEAGVWYATSEDVPGLAAEAPTLEALIEEVKRLVPDLLALNCDVRGPVDISLIVTSRREERISVPAA